MTVDDARINVILFDEDAELARALARQLESAAVSVLVVQDLDQYRQQQARVRARGVILCAESSRADALTAALRACGLPAEVFHADKLTPLWELQGWLQQLAHARPPIWEGGQRLLGASRRMQELRAQVSRVAHFAEMSVLVTGETGTGKELVAQAIHELSCPQQPFVSVNCAAIPASLFETELFGHTKGAFTDAEERRVGLLEQAGEGTLFLDEVGELPPEVQPKLLRSLETRTFRRVGSQREQALRARVVSATHVDLLEPSSGFRSDLYFRLAGYAIHCPSLRERKEDVEQLARHFLAQFCSWHQLPPLRLTAEAVQVLTEHDFPGNVRELRGAMENAAIGARVSAIGRAELDVVLHPRGLSNTLRPSLGGGFAESMRAPSQPPSAQVRVNHLVGPGRPFASLAALEKHVILAACAECQGSLALAAQTLGMPRSTLRDKLRRYQAQKTGVGS